MKGEPASGSSADVLGGLAGYYPAHGAWTHRRRNQGGFRAEAPPPPIFGSH